MGKKVKWTVRGVTQDTVEKIAEVSETSRWTYGELVNQAVELWYDSLPEDDADEDAPESSPETGLARIFSGGLI